MQLFMGHIVPCLHFIERENIFSSCVSSTWFFFFKLGLCRFIYPHPLYFSPKLFFPKLVGFFLFLQGEKLVFNPCCSQGELLLFVGRVVSIFSYSLLRMFSVDLLIGLTLSIRDKKGEMKCENIWESCLFCLRGDKIVFQMGRI